MGRGDEFGGEEKILGGAGLWRLSSIYEKVLGQDLWIFQFETFIVCTRTIDLFDPKFWCITPSAQPIIFTIYEHQVCVQILTGKKRVQIRVNDIPLFIPVVSSMSGKMDNQLCAVNQG